MSTPKPSSQWIIPTASSSGASIDPVAVYVDGNGDFRLSTTEEADRIIVADGNGDHRLSTSGTVAARLYQCSSDIFRLTS